MQQYISRRKRCWKLLKEMDPQIELSEAHRADMLLDLAGIEKNERTMIQASIGNVREFDKVADALVLQHPRIHVREQRRAKPFGSVGKGASSSSGHRFQSKKFHGGKSRSKGKRYSKGHAEKTGYLAADQEEDPDEEQYWEEPYNDPAAEDSEEADAFIAGEDYEEDEGKDEVVEDPVEASELNCVAYLSEMVGTDCGDPASAAEFIQNSTVALLANGKGKGKGKGKYPIRPSNLTVQDRRAKLAELKEKTHCKACGRRGHWKGDPQCTMNKQSSGHSSGGSHTFNPRSHVR